MAVIDELLQANEQYCRTFTQGLLPRHPSRHVAVVTCMDARLDPLAMLGLQPGEAHVIRNAGAIVTEDVIRSLIVSTQYGETREVMVINHSECGATAFREEDARARLQRATGTDSVTPATFHAFTDVDDNLRQQVQKVRSHPWMPKDVPVRGFIYDVRTGRLTEARIP